LERLQACNGATPAFRVWGLAASRDRKDGARVLSVALAADDKHQTSRQMVLVMSMAVERGLLPAAVITATRGEVRFELGRSAPVWCPPCLAVALPTTAAGEAALDAEAQTTVAMLKGDPAVDSAAAATVAEVMRRARSEALEVVGLRYVWLSAAQAATAAHTTTHRPPASGGPVLALALRGRDAV
jgi:hypothetical protein